MRQWRDLTRHRTELTDQRTSVVNRRHNVLEDANIKLSTVISNMVEVSGRHMLRAIASGQRDPLVLSALRKDRLQASPEALQASLVGHVNAHHHFMLETLLDQVEFLELQLERLDQRISEQIAPFVKVTFEERARMLTISTDKFAFQQSPRWRGHWSFY